MVWNNRPNVDGWKGGRDPPRDCGMLAEGHRFDEAGTGGSQVQHCGEGQVAVAGRGRHFLRMPGCQVAQHRPELLQRGRGGTGG